MREDREKNLYLKLTLSIFSAIALSILLFFLLFRAAGIRKWIDQFLEILTPFLYGAAIAYVLRPVCNFWEKKLKALFEKTGKKRDKLAGALAIVISIALGLGTITVILILVLPEVFNSITGIVKVIPTSIDQFSSWVLQYVGDNVLLKNYVEQLSGGMSNTVSNWIRTTLLPGLQTILDGFSNSVVNLLTICYNFFIGIIVSIYLLASRRTFSRQWKMMLYSVCGRKLSAMIQKELEYADHVFGGFMTGKLVDSLIIGILCFVGALILRLPYAVLVSVIVGVTNVIPFFGPYIGAIPSALLILMVSPGKAMVFLIFVIILQQVDGNIIGPRIIGNVTGLSGFWVLFAIMVFGGLFGIVGMLIGVPVFAVLYNLIRKLVHKGVQFRKKQEEERENSPKEEAGKIEKTASVEAIFEEKIEKVLQ